MGVRLPYSRPKGAKQQRSEQNQKILEAMNLDDHCGSDAGLAPITEDDRQPSSMTQDASVARAISKPSETKSKEKIKSWKREDWNKSKHVTTTPTGPSWSSVIRRTVYDMVSDNLIEDVLIDDDLAKADDRYYISVLESDGTRRRNPKTILRCRSHESPDVCEV